MPRSTAGSRRRWRGRSGSRSRRPSTRGRWSPCPSGRGSPGARVGIVDVDGLILNQNLTGLYSVGENPVAAFREKLEAAAADPTVRAIVVRINSPGGSVTASDILAEELRRFREATGQAGRRLPDGPGHRRAPITWPSAADRVVAHPTTVTGGLGALINHYNLQDAAAQLNATAEAGEVGPDWSTWGASTAPLARRRREAPPGDGRRLPRPLPRPGRPPTPRHDRRRPRRRSPTAGSSRRRRPWAFT